MKPFNCHLPVLLTVVQVGGAWAASTNGFRVFFLQTHSPFVGSITHGWMTLPFFFLNHFPKPALRIDEPATCFTLCFAHVPLPLRRQFFHSLLNVVPFLVTCSSSLPILSLFPCLSLFLASRRSSFALRPPFLVSRFSLWSVFFTLCLPPFLVSRPSSVQILSLLGYVFLASLVRLFLSLHPFLVARPSSLSVLTLFAYTSSLFFRCQYD